MDQLDSNVYYGLKECIRNAVKKISSGELSWHEMPMILVDFYDWSVWYFDGERDATDHIEKEYTTDWDEPPHGEDEELVLIKYCTQYHMERWNSSYKDYKFYKEINGVKIYRKVSYVEFEPELIINVLV